MDMGKLSYYSRKIHRLLLFFVVTLGLTQMITGLIMKYPDVLPAIDQGSTRLLHFQTATYFSVAFIAQMLTGLVMYVTPWIIKRIQKSSLT